MHVQFSASLKHLKVIPSSLPSFLPHDKYLYSRSYSGSRADYDDEVCEARGVVVFCWSS